MKPRQPSPEHRLRGEGAKSSGRRVGRPADVAAGQPRRTSCTRPALGLRQLRCDAYPLEARFVVRPLLRPRRAGLRHRRAAAATLTRERIEARPAHAVALRRPAARARPPTGGLPVGCTPLIAGAAPRRGARPARAVHQGRGRQPDALVQGPRRVGRLREGRRARPRRRWPAPSTGNLAGAVAAQAAALGLDAYIFVPADLEREKIIAASVPGATVFAVEGNYDDVNRLCAELAVRAAVGVRERQRARRTTRRARRRSRSRRPSSSAGGCPTRSSRRSPPARCTTSCTSGFAQLLDVGLVEGDAAAAVRRPGRGLRAGRRGVGPRRATRCARCGPTRSPSRSRSARRPTAPTPSPSRAAPAAPIAAVPDDEIVEAIGLLARTTGIFTETAGGVTIATLARLAARGPPRPRRAAPSPTSRATA